jgi:hypothetical protein
MWKDWAEGKYLSHLPLFKSIIITFSQTSPLMMMTKVAKMKRHQRIR